ncbi:hypothetical protein [Rubritalea tangerina]
MSYPIWHANLSFMPIRRLIGLSMILAGFVSSFYGITGLVIATFLWVIGAAMFSHSFLK